MAAVVDTVAAMAVADTVVADTAVAMVGAMAGAMVEVDLVVPHAVPQEMGCAMSVASLDIWRETAG